MEKVDHVSIVKGVLRENNLDAVDLIHLADIFLHASWNILAKYLDPYLGDDKLSSDVNYYYDWWKRGESARAILMTNSPPKILD